jgi:peptide/nickel transport system ATP-binding protein
MSLSVEDLTVYYRSLRGDVKAVDGATFEIADGEIMGLAGESGCGKSTLGKSLIRMDARMRYVGGHVELDGRELPVWDDARMVPFRFQEVSLIPQYAQSALNPTRRIGGVVEDLLDARDVKLEKAMPELKRRLELVGLPLDVLSRFPMELSGGMKQRVVMVLSSLLDPSLLIADEVTSALDVSSQRAVAELLVEFRDRGFVKSIIVITHDLSVLYQIADTILVMYAGKLAEKAPAGTMVDAPKHPYTQLLLNSLPEVGVRFAEQRLAGIPGRPPSLLDPPAGCRFRARCPLAFEGCAQEPPFAPLEPGHEAACWKAAA